VRQLRLLLREVAGIPALSRLGSAWRIAARFVQRQYKNENMPHDLPEHRLPVKQKIDFLKNSA